MTVKSRSQEWIWFDLNLAEIHSIRKTTSPTSTEKVKWCPTSIPSFLSKSVYSRTSCISGRTMPWPSGMATRSMIRSMLTPRKVTWTTSSSMDSWTTSAPTHPLGRYVACGISTAMPMNPPCSSSANCIAKCCLEPRRKSCFRSWPTCGTHWMGRRITAKLRKGLRSRSSNSSKTTSLKRFLKITSIFDGISRGNMRQASTPSTFPWLARPCLRALAATKTPKKGSDCGTPKLRTFRTLRPLPVDETVAAGDTTLGAAAGRKGSSMAWAQVGCKPDESLALHGYIWVTERGRWSKFVHLALKEFCQKCGFQPNTHKSNHSRGDCIQYCHWRPNNSMLSSKWRHGQLPFICGAQTPTISTHSTRYRPI